MDAKTAEALEGSIKKWEAIVEGTGADQGPHNCPLCQMFFNNVDCEGCPVREATGKPVCNDTPYTLFSKPRKHDATCEYNVHCQPCTCAYGKEHAQAEVDFLKSLRDDPTDDHED